MLPMCRNCSLIANLCSCYITTRGMITWPGVHILRANKRVECSFTTELKRSFNQRKKSIQMNAEKIYISLSVVARWSKSKVAGRCQLKDGTCTASAMKDCVHL